MIEDYLKRHSARSVANILDALQALEGEVVEAVLIIDGEKGSVHYTTVFKSGTSFVFVSNGSYWVNNQQTTREIIEKQISKNKLAHDQYHALHKLLGIAL